MAGPAAVLSILVNASTGAAQAQLAKLNAQLGQTAATAQKSNATVSAIGKAAKYGAIGVAAGAAISIKAASDFESSFAEVRKTIDATEKQYAQLERGIRNMSKRIPVSADNIAELAGIAGQLGIQRKSVLAFTKTVAELGFTTNLHGEDAAKTLARIANIMGTSPKHYRRLGSTIVDLGNNLATTEAEITEMALRLAGAGKQIGISEAQTLALSGALSSVGIRAEAGGSAISKVMIEVASSIAQGDEKMAHFAKVAGLSSAGFKKAWEQDAASALVTFIEGLDRIRKSGGNVFGTLEKLGIKEIRMRDALLRASGAGDLFRRSLELGSKAWEENTALTEEANRRYQTTAAQWQMLKNNARDWAIGVGQNLLPHLKELMRVLRNPNLTAEEKFERLTELLNEKFVAALEGAARAAGQHGPRIIGQLASSMASAWTGMNPFAKMLSAAAIIRLVGGKGALLRTGKLIGGTIGTGVATSAAATAATGAAGGAAAGVAGGLIGSMKGRLLPIAKRVGLAGVGIALADSVIGEFGRRTKMRSDELRTVLEGTADSILGSGSFLGDKSAFGIQVFRSDQGEEAKKLIAYLDQMEQGRVRLGEADAREIDRLNRVLDLTEQQKRQVADMAALARRSEQLGVKVRIGMDPGAIQNLRNGLTYLKNGYITTAKDIEKVTKRNSRIIAQQFGKGTADGRKLQAQNLRAAGEALKESMLRQGKVTKDGLAKVKQYWRQADLVGATRKTARDMGEEWAKGMTRPKADTKKALDRMLDDMRQMSRPARQAAYQAWWSRVQEASKGSKREHKAAEDMRSKVLAEFRHLKQGSGSESALMATRVIANFNRLVNGSATALDFIGDNVSDLLGHFGVTNFKFKAKKVGKVEKRQRGGPINIGRPSGDSVPALLERGEYVLNRNAVKAVGREKLDAINFGAASRFQVGGMAGAFNVDGAKPGFVPFMNFLNGLYGPIYVMSGARPGSITTTGNVSNHASGNAVDISTTQNGLNQAYNAATLNATGPAARRMDALHAYMAAHIRLPGDFLWRTDTGGNHWNHIHRGITSAHADNPGMMMSYLSTLPHGEGFGALRKPVLEGPDGVMKDLGNAAIEKVFKAANDYVTRQMQVPMFGTGPLRTPHSFGGWQDALHQIASARGWDATAWMELVMRESSGNPQAVNPSSGAFGLGQFLGTTADAYAPFGAKSSDPVKQIQAMAKYIADRYGDPSAALAFHDSHNWYAAGGLVEMLQKGGAPGMTSKWGAKKEGKKKPKKMWGQGDMLLPLPRTFRVGSSKQGHRLLKKVTGQIKGFGLSDEMISRLTGFSGAAARWNEYASNASSLTSYDAEGNPIPGLFSGQPETHWLTKELESLFSLRNQILRAKQMADNRRQLLAKHIEQVKKQIAKVQAQLKREQRRQKRLQREIKHQRSVLERQVKQLKDAKDELEDLQGDASKRLPVSKGAYRRRALGDRAAAAGKIPAAQQAFEAARARVAGTRNRIRNLTDQARVSGDWIKTHQGNLKGLEGGRDAFQASFSGLGTTIGELLGNGGQLKGKDFRGLADVQGSGGPLEVMAALPPMGTLGGSILTAQSRLHQLAEDAKRITDKSSSGVAEERLRITEELLRQANQRTAVSERQFQVFAQLPPNFAGVFHQGGIVPGTGESTAIVKGREGIFTPEQMAALAPVGGDVAPQINLRVIVHENGEVAVLDEDLNRKIDARIEHVSRRSGRRVASGARRGGVR